MTAIGVMRAAFDLSLNIPRDLSVIGFDDIRLAQFMTPPLTTVQTSQPEIATLTSLLPHQRASLPMRSLLVGLTLIVIAIAAPRMAAQKVELSIDASKPGAKIDRNLFGQFAEHLGHGINDGIWVGSDSAIPNTRGIRNDVVAALKLIHVPNVRWPGGCFADEYHWSDGIGSQRVVRLNPNWGGVIEPNTFGTHEFMDFIYQIGSEAYG